ncbi:hypothetical protein SY86_16575 [Erwinia tracheiphila]|uniref:Uncharacterized protein n=1 Tax=Erwinia tracheiphila TaxID=65700 RepID=A0A0M2KH83_9GAMM|nr:hypothetical protein ETR_22571 [Erwinia tracheiphila PSU-1]KKF36687.1 hypothetical protein SY86_16575 [Erwinia tracheiphila]
MVKEMCYCSVALRPQLLQALDFRSGKRNGRGCSRARTAETLRFICEGNYVHNNASISSTQHEEDIPNQVDDLESYSNVPGRVKIN